MQWIHEYDLFLFDFDGLLVNTEELHFEAYKLMCGAKGFDLDWSFEHYARIAHTSSKGLKEQIYKKFPELALRHQWDVLYKEKTEAYLDLLTQGKVQLMPGAQEFLQEIAKRNKKTCVVTNSSREMVERIIDKHAALQLINYWITREDYDKPKPDSECYLRALKEHSSQGEKVVGFEDSPRGLMALLGANVDSIFISQIDYPDMEKLMGPKTKRFASFAQLIKNLD